MTSSEGSSEHFYGYQLYVFLWHEEDDDEGEEDFPEQLPAVILF